MMGQEAENDLLENETENGEKKGPPRKLRCRCRKVVVWHFGCINRWLRDKGKCPLCKDDVAPFTQS
jgi:hypothetical protein